MLMVAAGVARWTFVSQVLLVLGAVSMVIGAGTGLAPLLLRRKDPYDLSKLKEIQEKDELRAAEATMIEPDAETVCPSCFESYSSRLPACPRCGRVP